MSFVAIFLNNYIGSVFICVPENCFRLKCTLRTFQRVSYSLKFSSYQTLTASSSFHVELFVFFMTEKIYDIFCPYRCL